MNKRLRLHSRVKPLMIHCREHDVACDECVANAIRDAIELRMAPMRKKVLYWAKEYMVRYGEAMSLAYGVPIWIKDKSR